MDALSLSRATARRSVLGMNRLATGIVFVSPHPTPPTITCLCCGRNTADNDAINNPSCPFCEEMHRSVDYVNL